MARNFDHARFVRLLDAAMQTGPIGSPQRLSQKDFATLVGVNPATVYRWSVGESRPSRKTVAGIANLFGWPPALVDELFLQSPVSTADAADDLDHWIEITGLRHDFPLLHRPSWFDDDLFDHDTSDGATLLEESARVWTVRPGWLPESLIVGGVVEFPVGQGVSTAVRAAYLQAEAQALTARQAPVMVSLEDLITAPYTDMLNASIALLDEVHPAGGRGSFDEPPGGAEALLDRADETAAALLGGITTKRARDLIERKIRWSLVRGLLAHRWERAVMKADPYLRLLGLNPDDFDDSGSGGDRQVLDERRALLRRLLPSTVDGDWTELEILAPRLVNDDLREIIFQLNVVARLRLLLLVDLSPTPIGRTYLGPTHGEYLTKPYLEAAAAIMHALEQILDCPEEKSDSLIDTMVAAPHGPRLHQFKFLVGDRARSVPPLDATDLFEMLRTAAFRPEVRVPSNGLDDVLDNRYLELSPNCGLTTASWLLRQTLAQAEDRRVHEGGDQSTAERLGEVLRELEPVELRGVTRMLELLRRKQTSDMVRS